MLEMFKYFSEKVEKGISPNENDQWHMADRNFHSTLKMFNAYEDVERKLRKENRMSKFRRILDIIFHPKSYDIVEMTEGSSKVTIGLMKEKYNLDKLIEVSKEQK